MLNETLVKVYKSINKEDGNWYPATIIRISELGIHLKFNEFGGEEILQEDFIRITPEQEVANLKLETKKKKDNKEDEKEEKFVIPDRLKINPNDNEETRLLKRKRVKQLKNTEKQKKEKNFLYQSQLSSKKQ